MLRSVLGCAAVALAVGAEAKGARPQRASTADAPQALMDLPGDMLKQTSASDVVKAMTAYIDSPEEQSVGFWMLTTIAEETATGAKDIRKVKGVRAIVAGMNAHNRDTPLVTKGARALAMMAQKHRNAIVKAGGIGTLTDIMQLPEHVESGDLQSEASRALGNLANGDAVASSSVVSAGGLDRIMEALRALPDLVAVQEQGIAAVVNVVMGSTANKQTVVSAGGVDIVLAAMQAHNASSAVAAGGCTLLQNLAAQLPDVVGKGGGVRGIMQITEKHPKSPAVLTPALSCMWNLVHASEDWGEQVVYRGGVELAERVLDDFESPSKANTKAHQAAEGLLGVIKERREAGQLGGRSSAEL